MLLKDMRGDMREKMINHKGTKCIIDYRLLCQEGFCVECQIYQNWLNNDTPQTQRQVLAILETVSKERNTDAKN